MSNPPKRKGTAEETSIVRRWNEWAGRIIARRTAASSTFDILVQDGEAIHEPIEVLSTRADRGQRLYTLREDDFLTLWGAYEFARHTPVHIESKRYARFALHTIFEKKFGRKS